MQTKQGIMLQALRAVQAFLVEHAAQLPTVVGTGMRRKLDEAIAELVAHVGEQSGSAFERDSATQKQRTLRRALVRDHMLKIARIARTELPPSATGIDALRMPKGVPTAEQLFAAAYGMAKAAGPYVDVFTSAALPADFREQLTRAADALVASLADRKQKRSAHRKATLGLRTKLAAGRRLVQVLDALVESELQDEPVMLAGWKLVSRVPKVPGGGRPSTSTATAPTQIVPPTAP